MFPLKIIKSQSEFAKLGKALSQSDTVISAWDGSKLIDLVNAIDNGELTAYAHYLLIRPEYQNIRLGP